MDCFIILEVRLCILSFLKCSDGAKTEKIGIEFMLRNVIEVAFF